MQRYIKKYKYKSVDYTAFKEVLEDLIREKYEEDPAKKLIGEINWDKWLLKRVFLLIKMHFPLNF